MHRLAGLQNPIDAGHLLHAERRGITRARQRLRRNENHAGIRRFGDAIGECVVDSVCADQVTNADVVRAGADGRDCGVIKPSAEWQHAGVPFDAGIVDDLLDDRRLFVQILAHRSIDGRLVGARDDASLIVEQDDQIGAKGLAALLELISDADEIDDRRLWRSAGRRRNGRCARHCFLDVSDELRIVPQKHCRQRKTSGALMFELAKEPRGVGDRRVDGVLGDAAGPLDRDSHSNRDDEQNQQRG